MSAGDQRADQREQPPCGVDVDAGLFQRDVMHEVPLEDARLLDLLKYEISLGVTRAC